MWVTLINLIKFPIFLKCNNIRYQIAKIQRFECQKEEEMLQKNFKKIMVK